MSFSKVYSAQVTLLKARIIGVEVDLSSGLHSFALVGLPDKAVEESRDRVSAAIKNTGFKSPKQKNQKTIISLSPADVRKEGPAFDLAVAVGYLHAAGELNFNPKGKLFLGELSLDGSLQKINGVLPLVVEARRRGFTEVYLPSDNAREAALIQDITVFGAQNLRAIVEHLDPKVIVKKPPTGDGDRSKTKLQPQPKTEIVIEPKPGAVDFADIRGQVEAKRGLEIAAAGGHNIALFGPPGTGKTMLARAFCQILPPLTFEEILEATAIHSVAGLLVGDLLSEPPIRAPHHTASYVSLVGGGTFPKPGEVTLAHHGVLFLDEFAEFERRVIDSLRQPLEDGMVSVSRAKGSVQFPARFILIAAMNPCPCGNYGSKDRDCTCSPIVLERYRQKISGPILDRIDMWIEVPRIPPRALGSSAPSVEKSNLVRERVIRARLLAQERFKKAGRRLSTNSEMGARDLGELVKLEPSVENLLANAAERLGLSGRAYHRVIKLARTIADLYGSIPVKNEHILEAIRYRPRGTRTEF